MCSGCRGFFAKKYKARHMLICPAGGKNLVVPMVNIASCRQLDSLPGDFKDLLNTLYSDEVGNYIKTDSIILMFGLRYFGALKRKKDKVHETRKYVRGRMRLVARVHLAFKDVYGKQEQHHLNDTLNNAADMYRRDMIPILAEAVRNVREIKRRNRVAINLRPEKWVKSRCFKFVKIDIEFFKWALPREEYGPKSKASYRFSCGFKIMPR